jgi:hypothetical protein
MTDFDALRRDIRVAAEETFADLRSRHPGEICGYALYSDSDGITVCCAANTRQHLAAARAEYPDDAEMCRWSPAEWGYEGIAGSVFAPLSKRLYTDWSAGLDQVDFDADAFRNQVYEACVTTLESLVHEGFFGGSDRDDVVVMFVVSDDEHPARGRRWIHRLNPPHLARSYDQLFNPR